MSQKHVKFSRVGLSRNRPKTNQKNHGAALTRLVAIGQHQTHIINNPPITFAPAPTGEHLFWPTLTPPPQATGEHLFLDAMAAAPPQANGHYHGPPPGSAAVVAAAADTPAAEAARAAAASAAAAAASAAGAYTLRQDALAAMTSAKSSAEAAAASAAEAKKAASAAAVLLSAEPQICSDISGLCADDEHCHVGGQSSNKYGCMKNTSMVQGTNVISQPNMNKLTTTPSYESDKTNIKQSIMPWPNNITQGPNDDSTSALFNIVEMDEKISAVYDDKPDISGMNPKADFLTYIKSLGLCGVPHNCGQLNGKTICGKTITECNVCEACCFSGLDQGRCDQCFAAPPGDGGQGCGNKTNQTGAIAAGASILNISLPLDTSFINLGDVLASNYQVRESYSMTITKDISGGGINVVIGANSHIGLGYALVTLQQLIEVGDNGLVIHNLPIKIQDKPKTHRRMVMLDTARTYFHPDTICNLLQKMAFNKMNHLDWHISDNQSFPLAVGEITDIFSKTPSKDPLFLGMMGAFAPDKIYTAENITRIIRVAQGYGITIIPGIDTPGHCSALMYGSKEVTKKLYPHDASGLQIIKYYDLKSQSEFNAPEPIIGYLDIAGDSSANIPKITHVVHSILWEVILAFQLVQGTAGKILNLNADEVQGDAATWKPGAGAVIPDEEQKVYMNRLIALFNTPVSSKELFEEYFPLEAAGDWEKAAADLTKIKIMLWIDPILALNINASGQVENNIDLSGLDADNRLILGIWNLWPTVSVTSNNKVTARYTNTEVINYNAANLYMDAGATGSDKNGYSYSAVDASNINATYNLFWIGAVPNIIPQFSPMGRGYSTGFGKVYNYNFKYDFVGDGDKWTGMEKINNINGSGLAVWTETISEGLLDSKLITNMCAYSETLWKYDEEHAPDNLPHAGYRLHYHLLQMKQAPYNVNSNVPMYSYENIHRPFPQGAVMSKEDKILLAAGGGDITQTFLDINYPLWNITIRDPYIGHVNNNLMYDINPLQQNGTNVKTNKHAISQFPLSSLTLFKYVPQDLSNNTDIRSRINPWLAEDINTFMNNPDISNNLARTNFSISSAYYEPDQFYMDQRDAPIELGIINNSK
jgi:hypothetical protein